MIKLAPSILAADFAKLGDEVVQLDQAGAEYIHIDVMDGSFVPSLSLGMPVIKSIRNKTNKVFDTHLMVDEPIRYVEDIYKSGADIITVHAEACKHLQRTIAYIKELGAKVGVALNPATPLTVLDYVLEDIDMVLIMSVNPGFGGQKLLPSSFQKIKELKEKITDLNLTIDIEVDGGITTSNVGDIIAAGANVIVAGTSVFSGNIANNITEFKSKFYE